MFFWEYLKNLRSVGAVLPSSRYLAREMVRSIDFDTARTIVELGAGTGVFTEELIRRKRATTKLLVIENNPAFAKTLRERCEGNENVYIVEASAEDVSTLLKKYRLPTKVDYIVSGLPFASLPREVSHAILSAAKRHVARGHFITFQYTLLKKSFLQQYFSSVQASREYRNIPPAYVLRATNDKR